MIYAKIKLTEDTEIRTALYGDELYSICPVCGAEVPIEPEDLPGHDDLAGTSVFCGKCGKDFRSLSPNDGDIDWKNILRHSDFPSKMFDYGLKNAPIDILDEIADEFVKMVPGYHDDLPLGEINAELARRERESSNEEEHNG